jgi:Ion channel
MSNGAGNKQLLVFGMCLISMLFYYFVEPNFSLLDSLYLSVGVMTTVGMFIHPSTFSGRWYTVMLSILSFGVTANYFQDLAISRVQFFNSYLKINRRKSNDSVLFSSSNNKVSSGYDVDVLISLAVYNFVLISITALVVTFTETDYRYLDSLYLCLTLATSVGTADLEPSGQVTKIVLILYLYFSCNITLFLLSNFGTYFGEQFESYTSKIQVINHFFKPYSNSKHFDDDNRTSNETSHSQHYHHHQDSPATNNSMEAEELQYSHSSNNADLQGDQNTRKRASHNHESV